MTLSLNDDDVIATSPCTFGFSRAPSHPNVSVNIDLVDINYKIGV